MEAADDEDRQAYDLKARVVHARHAFKKSYKKHARNIIDRKSVV